MKSAHKERTVDVQHSFLAVTHERSSDFRGQRSLLRLGIKKIGTVHSGLSLFSTMDLQHRYRISQSSAISNRSLRI